MNCSKFKVNSKFRKQKFGTPIGSVIFSMLAEIVMEDLERSVFKRCLFIFGAHDMCSVNLKAPFDKRSFVSAEFCGAREIQ